MKIRMSVVCVVVLTTSVFFWRGVRDSFDLTKATLLWVSAPALLVAMVGISVVARRLLLSSQHLPWVGLAAAFLVSSLAAQSFGYAVVGQPARFTGLLTIYSGLIVGLVVATIRGLNPIRPVLLAYSISAIACAGYLFLQARGQDFYEWSTVSFGPQVFGTIGNPNTASAFLAVTAPMSLWVSFDPSCRRAWRLVAGFSSGVAAGSMPSLVSFQGQIIVTVVGMGLLVHTLVTRKTRNFEFLSRITLGILFVVSPLLPASPWQIPMVGVIALGLLSISLIRPSVSAVRSQDEVRRAAKTVAVLGGVGLVMVSLSPVREILRDGLAGGLLERGDFYRTAWQLFVEKPIFGGGFENFWFDFSRLRPEGHALRLENSRPSSVHSVPLAMFASGGLVLGLTYLGFVVLVFIRGFRAAASRFGGPDQKFLLLLTWFVINVQSLVSVEHVSLYLQFFVVAGLIEFAASQGLDSAAGRVRRINPRQKVWIAGAAVVLTIALAAPLTRPFRASSIALDATVQFSRDQNRAAAIEDYERVVALSPWDFTYRYELGVLTAESGDVQRGTDLLVDVAKRTNYGAGFVTSAVSALAYSSRLEEAAQLLLRAVENDPYAQGLRQQSADFLTQMADQFVKVQDLANAQLFYERALQVVPAFERAKAGLAALGVSPPD